MKPQIRLTERFKSLFRSALALAESIEADRILLLLDNKIDFVKLSRLAGNHRLLIAADSPELLEGSEEAGFDGVLLNMPHSPIYERLTQALLEAVADDILPPGSRVVTIYSGFDSSTIDSISIVNLGEHLDRLSGRDLRKLETRVPLDTLKAVVDLAVEIGREGREGKAIGTLFVVGDHRKVLTASHAGGFDPVKGYSTKERDLNDPRVREGIKEIAQMDGAIIVRSDGVVAGACRILDSSAEEITLSKGLGSRHWAAAAVSRSTGAIAVAVSQSNGTVRLFHNGEVILRIEPHRRRAMVWRDFEYESPGTE